MDFQGLNMSQVKERQKTYGSNVITSRKDNKFLNIIKHVIKEPIYILLAVSGTIYFALGESVEGIIMIAFVLFVIFLDLIQDIRSRNILKKLTEESETKASVIREGKKMSIPSKELVPGDVLLVSQGNMIAADGGIVSSWGLCIDESILTGESEGVWKTDYCYGGTLVVLGNAVIIVENIGNETEYGKIADQAMNGSEKISPLQRQMNQLAKVCTLLAAILFLLVSFVSYFNLQGYPTGERIIQSGLAGVALALSMVPAEFPIIQSSFLSMGALRLGKKNALVRKLSSVETLGAVSVLCLDKTGTITKNKMEVKKFIPFSTCENDLCSAVSLACKEGSNDPMDKAILKHISIKCNKDDYICLKACSCARAQPSLIKEYVFTNQLKAMGQLWQFTDKFLLAVKGSSETILPLCDLPIELMNEVKLKVEQMSMEGLRVIIVGEEELKSKEEIPESLLDCKLKFKGIIALVDPPKDNIKMNIKRCYKAGIRIIMITGDHPLTASSIGQMVGIKNNNYYITGDELSDMTDDELMEKVKGCNIFARVLPINKMRIIEALKANGEITAMTGDGVNDSPALKKADIGVAMGQSGSQVSAEVADLVLLDDNFSTILDSVKDGRRIYQNITKALGYVLAIHLPIALISLLAPLMGIVPESLLLLPLHIVLLELIMDPTCSFALESLPADDDVLDRPPRNPSVPLLSVKTILKSILQGVVIFLFSFSSYYILLMKDMPVEVARSMGYGILILANVFLLFENASDQEHIFYTIKKLKNEKAVWIVTSITVLQLILMLYSPAGRLLKLAGLSVNQFIVMTFLSIVAVLWYEIVKFIKRKV